MWLSNLKDPSERVTFTQAVLRGLGRERGLFFPDRLDQLIPLDEEWPELSSIDRNTQILTRLIGPEFDDAQVRAWVERSFTFSAPLQPISHQRAPLYACELFHGPTLAFKDFGARFMAQVLETIASPDQPLTILTATSGDTGAAVAHAFYGLKQVQVYILYPREGVSPLQERLFCTLGGNIHTLAVDGTFDDCQALVKRAFDDPKLCEERGLTSANSINISRLIAQACYYFEALAPLSPAERMRAVFSVPCGNFGNFTAGLLAQCLGLPVQRWVIATNHNDTVPRYLQTGQWSPEPTRSTLSNAMDVSDPSNWARIEALISDQYSDPRNWHGVSVSEAETIQALHELYERGYLCEPHGAVAYQALKETLTEDEVGIFLCTAHPAKFKDRVDSILGCDLELPVALAQCAHRELLSLEINVSDEELRRALGASPKITFS